MPFAPFRAVPFCFENSRNQVSHDSKLPHAENTEHHHMSVTDNPIRKVDQSLECHRHLQRTLKTGQEVEQDTGVEISQRKICHHQPASTVQCSHKVNDHCHDYQFQCNRRKYGPVLQEHRDRRIQEMVDSLQWIKERQTPESDK